MATHAGKNSQDVTLIHFEKQLVKQWASLNNFILRGRIEPPQYVLFFKSYLLFNPDLAQNNHVFMYYKHGV